VTWPPREIFCAVPEHDDVALYLIWEKRCGEVLARQQREDLLSVSRILVVQMDGWNDHEIQIVVW
jgi:hypothetical protein